MEEKEEENIPAAPTKNSNKITYDLGNGNSIQFPSNYDATPTFNNDENKIYMIGGNSTSTGVAVLGSEIEKASSIIEVNEKTSGSEILTGAKLYDEFQKMENSLKEKKPVEQIPYIQQETAKLSKKYGTNTDMGTFTRWQQEKDEKEYRKNRKEVDVANQNTVDVLRDVGEAIGGDKGKFIGATIGEAAQDYVEFLGGTGHAIGAGLAEDVKKKDFKLSTTRNYLGHETKIFGDAVINQGVVLAKTGAGIVNYATGNKLATSDLTKDTYKNYLEPTFEDQTAAASTFVSLSPLAYKAKYDAIQRIKETGNIQLINTKSANVNLNIKSKTLTIATGKGKEVNRDTKVEVIEEPLFDETLTAKNTKTVRIKETGKRIDDNTIMDVVKFEGEKSGTAFSHYDRNTGLYNEKVIYKDRKTQEIRKEEKEND